MLIPILKLDQVKTENIRRLISYLELCDDASELTREELINYLFEENLIKMPRLGWPPTHY